MIQSRKTYRIEGLSCANCAGKFERNVRGLASVEEAQVNFGASKIYVTGDPTVEELEGAGAFENLKLTLDERKRLVRTLTEAQWRNRPLGLIRSNSFIKRINLYV